MSDYQLALQRYVKRDPGNHEATCIRSSFEPTSYTILFVNCYYVETPVLASSLLSENIEEIHSFQSLYSADDANF